MGELTLKYKIISILELPSRKLEDYYCKKFFNTYKQSIIDIMGDELVDEKGDVYYGSVLCELLIYKQEADRK